MTLSCATQVKALKYAYEAFIENDSWFLPLSARVALALSAIDPEMTERFFRMGGHWQGLARALDMIPERRHDD